MTSIMKRLTWNRRATNLRRGNVKIHVGKKVVHKIEMNANILNHPLVGELLRESVEEFGYSYSGALRIACEKNVFLHLVSLLESGRPEVHYMELQDLMRKFSDGEKMKL
ncbi:Small auxin-up RNA protein [Dioscorea alata]|uniref:Small auxin-up RNA protein n=1 Tax=Dioscorea alata TaxID=55571 RepID=A0ACB7UWI3_DIOAL|nr:Small auxin-up RNA protein [Dioscorea alata]